MLERILRTAGFVVLPAFALLLSVGCGGTGLPDTLTVELPDGTQEEVTLGSGVISFADSSWQFYRGVGNSAQGVPFVIIRFGPNGELAAFENNTIASQIFGSDILFDGERHDTTQASLQYAAATYGAETADAHGFAFEGLLAAYVPVLGEVAHATASAVGEFDGDDINTIVGTFEFVSDVTTNAFNLVPKEYVHMEEAFDFIGQRIEE